MEITHYFFFFLLLKVDLSSKVVGYTGVYSNVLNCLKYIYQSLSVKIVYLLDS